MVFVSYENNQLVFRPKTVGVPDPRLNDFVDQNLYDKGPLVPGVLLFPPLSILSYWFVLGEHCYPLPGRGGGIRACQFPESDDRYVAWRRKSARENSAMSVFKKWIYWYL